MPSAKRTPQHESLEIVLVGGFNPAIFHPEWFLRHALVGAEDAANATVKMVSTDVTDITIAGVRVLCMDNRLTVASGNIAYFERVHDLVVGSLTLLSHVPIRAFGINPRQHYAMESVQQWHEIGHRLAPKAEVWDQLYKGPGMLNLTIQSPYEGDLKGMTNVTVQPSDRTKPGLMIFVNNHFEIPLEFQQTEAAAIVSTAIRNEWTRSCMEASRVAGMIFQRLTD